MKKKKAIGNGAAEALRAIQTGQVREPSQAIADILRMGGLKIMHGFIPTSRADGMTIGTNTIIKRVQAPTRESQKYLSYFSICDAEVEEGEKKIKITLTGGTSTEQTLILATSDRSEF